MIEINGTSFSGSIVGNENDTLSVLIRTVDEMQDLAQRITGASSVTEIADGQETNHTVTMLRAIKSVSYNTFLAEFSTKQSFAETVEAKIQQQSDAIDELLVMLLEG